MRARSRGWGPEDGHRRRRRPAALAALGVVVTIPLPVLRTIPAEFSPDVTAAIGAVEYVPAGKVAFQAERRFWELDRQIYGGLSWQDQAAQPCYRPLILALRASAHRIDLCRNLNLC